LRCASGADHSGTKARVNGNLRQILKPGWALSGLPRRAYDPRQPRRVR
jgi:hypothetical protein